MATYDPRSSSQDPIEGDVVHHASRMVGEAKAFGRSLGAASTRMSDQLDLAGRVQRNPIASVLVAAGVGYVLGGGLFSRVTRDALRLGLKLAIIPFAKGQFSSLSGSDDSRGGEPL
jgi:hypothetical protein